jgi:flagellar FliL protein
MADKKTIPAADSAKAPEEGAPAVETPKAKSGLMPVLISSITVGVLLGGVGFALAYYVLPSRLAQQPAAAAAPVDVATPIVKEKTERAVGDAGAASGKAVTKFTIEEITVNIADTRGNRFVRAGVDFEAAPEVLEELEANRPRMIDTLGQVLSTKTLDELTSPNIRGNLRTELLGIINPTLKAGRVDNLYFTDLLVQ